MAKSVFLKDSNGEVIYPITLHSNIYDESNDNLTGIFNNYLNRTTGGTVYNNIVFDTTATNAGILFNSNNAQIIGNSSNELQIKGKSVTFNSSLDTNQLIIDTETSMSLGTIYPAASQTYNLGSSTKRFNELYLNTINTSGNALIAGDLSVNGAAVIRGNLTLEGKALETHIERIYSTNDYITLREGTTAGLSTGSYAGFEFTKYDGTNNGRLVIDKDGIVRAGDVGDEQPLATREENPTNGGYARWDASTNRFVTDTNVALKADLPIYSDYANRILKSFKGVTRLTNSAYATLKAAGTVSVGGQTLTYDEAMLYITTDDPETYVSLTGNQTVDGNKTFTGDIAAANLKVGNANIQYISSTNTLKIS